MLLMRPPGVYRPQGDTELLTQALRDAGIRPGARVLEVCTGTGAVALAAALGRSPGEVTAVDISARAVWAAWFNARARGLRVRVLRGDLFAPVEGETFDVILANPPYVVADGPAPPPHSRTRAWDAGPEGRSLLDRICAGAPAVLSPGGILLMVHSALCGVDRTLGSLRSAGLKASVITRRREAFGPVMSARAPLLEAKGLIMPGQDHEELVVIRADRIESAG
jgi:release factor glutamine methyltransferase